MWIIDTCAIVRAQDAGHLEAFLDAAQGLGATLAEEVALEVSGRPGKVAKPEQVVAARAVKARTIPTLDIPMGSPAAQTYARLRAGRTGTTDAGECQSIALALHRPDALFVTAEQRAGWLALVELEDRARAFPSLLRAMVGGGHLDRAIAEEIQEAAEQRSGVRRPTWWGGGG